MAVPKIIRTDAEYRAAMDRITALLDADAPDAVDELETWSILVEHYEATQYPIEAPAPLAYLEAVMALKGLTQSDLAAVLGSRSRASDVLAGRRDLSKAMVRRIGEAWRVPVEPLLGLRRPSSGTAAA